MGCFTEMTDIILPAKKTLILDATTLSSLMSCARLTDLRFNHNLVSINGKSNSLECGSIVHKFLEVYYGAVINGIKKSDAVGHGMIAAELYARGCPFCTNFVPTENDQKPRCGHQINEYEGVKNTPEVADKSIPKEKYAIGWRWALKTCEEYAEHYKNDFWIPLFVETVKGEVLYEDDEIRVMWKAKLDLGVDTNQGIYPVDHKTMKQRRDTVSLNNQFIGQCILMKTRKVIINKIGFQTTLEPKDKFIRASVDYSLARLMEWQGEILPYWAYKMIDFSENNYWPPNFTHCENKYGTCPFIDVCESDPQMREDELKRLFVVTEDWNPVNVVEEE